MRGVYVDTYKKNQQDVPLKTWRNYRDKYLGEMNRLEGRRGEEDCRGCRALDPVFRQTPSFRCEDCFGSELLCQGCCVSQHRALPLHRIKVSNYLSYCYCYSNV